MIDFRYHLVSIVAVLLALAIGIVLGSGFLGGPVLDYLRTQVDEVAERNQELSDDVAELDRRLDAYQDFAERAEGYLSDSALAGDDVVIFHVDGTDGGVLDGVRQSVENAGGRIASTITATSKLSLGDPATEDELAAIIGTQPGAVVGLRVQAATALGNAAGAAAARPPLDDLPRTGADERLDELVGALEAARYVAVDRGRGGRVVPPGASFVIVGGSAGESPFDVSEFVTALATNLAEHGAAVVVAEPSESSWNVVTSIREDVDASASTSTVDQAETVPGRIAVVLGLDRAARGLNGHYGVKPGVDGVIPEATPSG